MDDTQQSRMSDAAATRKRRSSILKSQRPARTPFSELEFNVATPTDSAKSRRVSFSRRTGVAEFVTNEATTTWKNFYEEHNKSLESSGNDSDANASRQPVGHLGKRIFDQQFEEVEAVDFIGSLNPNINGSINNVNFTDLASLDNTEGKITAPQNKFELSALTDQQSKLFGNDFTNQCGEMSGRIDINFSAIQQIGENDDLDEIQRDIARVSNNVACHGPFDRQNMSEYIEVDLNMTHMEKNDEDMSITDTVTSPKVQDISKSSSIEKKVSLNKDWVADKENIVMNPYAAPRESDKFAINDEPEQVLVFDGKRLTLQTERDKNKEYRQTLLPDTSAETPQRKTIVLNVNDDLPNFAEELLNSKCENTCVSSFTEIKSRTRNTTMFNDNDISMTLPVNKVGIIPNRSKNFENTGNLSMTQALPTNIINETSQMMLEKSQHIRTIVYEEDTGNISVTQTLPAKIITSNTNLTERRRTVVYEDETGNISITQAIPTNIILNEKSSNEKRKTIVFDDDKGNISITQAISSNIILSENNSDKDKRKTIVFDDDNGNVSITQAVPANVVLSERLVQEKRRTIIYEDDMGNLSVTQALPLTVLIQNNESQEKRTVVYQNDTGNISVSQAVPQNHKRETMKSGSEGEIKETTIPTTHSLPTNIILKNSDVNKRRTIVYEDDTGNISITQAIPTQLIQGYIETSDVATNVEERTDASAKKEKRKTIVFDDDNDISMTQAIPANIIEKQSSEERRENRKPIVFNHDGADISITQANPTNVFLLDKLDSAVEILKMNEENEDLIQAVDEELNEVNEKVTNYEMYEHEAAIEVIQEKQKTFIIHSEESDAEMSLTEAIPKVQNLIIDSNNVTSLRTNDNSNVSRTKPIPAELLAVQMELSNKYENKEPDLLEQHQVTKPCSDIIVYQANTTNSTPKFSKIEQGDSKSEKTLESTSNLDTKAMSLSKVIEDIEGKTMISQSSVTKEFSISIQDDINSEDRSILHPTVDAKCEMLNLKPSNITMDVSVSIADKSLSNVVENTSNVYKSATKVNKSLSNVVESTANVYRSASKFNRSLTSVDRKSVDFNKSIEKSSDVVKKVSFYENVEEKDPDIEDTMESKKDAQTEDLFSLDKPNDSVLDALLDMSVSEDFGTEDKVIMAKVESSHSSAVSATTTATKVDNDDTSKSSESMFYITRDSEDSVEAQTDKDTDIEQDKNVNKTATKTLIKHSLVSIENKDDPEMVTDLPKKLAELKTVVNQNKNTSMNKFVENVSPDIDDVVEKDENVEKLRQQSINFKKANDTQELLDMISGFTDNNDDDEDHAPKIKENLLSEHKTEEKRLSFAPNRQSIVISREDLLSNISMAQAALQKSRFELEESDSILEDTKNTTLESSIAKKSGRTSDVVKTLHFDDESSSEISFRNDKSSPLKKTAFGETAYMTESKSKVIPSYLKDVSDGIKELMLDLVKPMTDTMPFDSNGVDKSAKKATSTASIQANLVTSSQIDIESELYSEYTSDMRKESPLYRSGLNKSKSHSLKSPIKFSTEVIEKSREFDVPAEKLKNTYSRSPEKCPSPPPVIVFDHLNPLNNILLGNFDYTEAHRYDPVRPDTLRASLNKPAPALVDAKDIDMEHVTTQYRMEAKQNAIKEGCKVKQEDEKSIISKASITVSIDQSCDAKLIDFKDSEVNTLIAMKGNKELLEASSSLTLVDDAVGYSDGETDVKSGKEEPHHKVKISRSPVEIIYKIEEQTLTEFVEFESTSNDEDPKEKKAVKAKKRIYSPSVTRTPVHTVDVTPKPNSKMQKLSSSPNVYRNITVDEPKMAAEKDITEQSPKTIEKRKSPKKNSKKQGGSITVQQLITDYNNIEAEINQIDKKFLNSIATKSDTSPGPNSDVDSHSLGCISSFTSSKNMNTMKNSSSTTESQRSQLSTIASQPSRIDWHPELINGLSSKNLIESDSAVNVVAKIDMLPFMGSHECEWENSCPDTWSFRLLHGRLRLTVRLAHRHDNATRTRVRGDTPVLDTSVETVQEDKKNPVATLCVRFACETMRYMVSHVCKEPSFARDVPPLLRRCAAVARVALRWGRAMHDAKLHLAYTLDSDGHLTLKVANIPLRSVWEVSMRVELVVGDAREAPWPRASDVRVARVVSDVSVPEHDVRRALAHTPRDWGHAPRTIWRMFRYLKRKTRDDDLLLA